MIITLAICCIGTVCNTLVIYVWRKNRSTNVTTYLLSFLALADLCFVLAMAMFSILTLTETETQRSTTPWANFLCFCFSIWSQYVSVFTTVLVAIVRFLSVQFPLRIRVWFPVGRIKKMLLLLVTLSLFVGIIANVSSACLLYGIEPAALMENDITTADYYLMHPDRNTSTVNDVNDVVALCNILFDQHFLIKSIPMVLHVLILFIVPGFSICLVNILMIRKA